MCRRLLTTISPCFLVKSVARVTKEISQKKNVSAQYRTLGVRHKALTSFVCLFVFFTDLFSLVRQTSQKKRLLVVDVSYAKV